MRRLAVTAVGLALASLGSSCRHPVTPPGPWHEEAGYRWRDLPVPSSRRGGVGTGAGAGFTELSASRTGISFTNTVTLDSALWNRHLAQGGGVALGDVDGDGLPDIYLTSNEGSNALYKNLGDWRFEDITAKAGVAMPGRHSTGAVFADVDGDGDLDLLVSTLGGGVALFLNDGHGVFTERTTEAGLASHAGSMTMTLTDVDGDGHLDLYVANYKARSALDIYPPQERAFNQVVRQVGQRFEVVPKFQKDYRVVDRPEYNLVSMQQRADPDGFYVNDGTGHFTLVPWTKGRFLDETGKPLAAAPEYFALSAKFTDVDGDGAPDLYVCDDFEDPDLFWLNDGTGTFRAVPRLAVRNTSNSSMAVDFSDVDRDGNVDILVVDMLGRGARRKAEIPTHTPLPKLIGQIDDRPQWQRNTLLRNRGDGTFEQIAGYAGIEASDWTWDVLFLDVDLDGYEDVLATTGHLWDVMDADTWERIRTTFTGAAWRRELALFPKLALRSVAFHNNGDLTFSDVGERWGFGGEDAISHGMATADLDGDGDLDVVVNRLNSPAAKPARLARGRVQERRRGAACGRTAARRGTEHRGCRLEDSRARRPGTGATERGRARGNVPLGVRPSVHVRRRHGPRPHHRGRLAAPRAFRGARGEAQPRVRNYRAASGPGHRAARGCAGAPRGAVVPRCLDPTRPPPCRDAVQRLDSSAAPPPGVEPARAWGDVVRRRRRRPGGPVDHVGARRRARLLSERSRPVQPGRSSRRSGSL